MGLKSTDSKMGNFFDSIGSFFSSGDKIPWCDRDVILECEKEVRSATEGGSEDQKKESIKRLSWALVHSRQTKDIQLGIAMLEASLASSSPPIQDREKIYLLAVGYYRTGDYSRSRQLVERCLEVQPDWRQALALKITIEDQIAKDDVIGIGITAAAVGLIAGGIAGVVAAALSRKK